MPISHERARNALTNMFGDEYTSLPYQVRRAVEEDFRHADPADQVHYLTNISAGNLRSYGEAMVLQFAWDRINELSREVER